LKFENGDAGGGGRVRKNTTIQLTGAKTRRHPMVFSSSLFFDKTFNKLLLNNFHNSKIIFKTFKQFTLEDLHADTMIIL